jgi:hypothetical protein
MLREGEHLAVLVALLLSLPRDDLDLGDTLGETQGGLERVGEPTLDARAANEPVDDNLDRVLLVPGEALATLCVPRPSRACSTKLVHLAVDPRPREPWPASSVSSPSYSPFRPARPASTWNRVPSRQLRDPVDDLLRRLPGDDLPAVGAVRHADPGEEGPQVVVDLRDRTDGRPGFFEADFWSIEIAGDRPSMKSTSGLSI